MFIISFILAALLPAAIVSWAMGFGEPRAPEDDMWARVLEERRNG